MHTPEKNQTLPMVLAASIAVMLQITVPFIAFAQAAPAAAEPAPVETQAPVPASEPPVQEQSPASEPSSQDPVADANVPVETQISDVQPTETVQETATSTQATAGADELAGTANPESGTTESDPIPVSVASSTESVAPAIIPIVEDSTELLPDEIPVAAQSDLTVIVADIKATEGAELSNRELNARIEPDFVMQLSGKTIPTVRAPGNTETVSTAVDSVQQILNVSGTCSDVYYVVLLYRNPSDYQTDPASYILNRAYPCENGSYTYAINDLPASVKNGTYYLLIGEQGDHGSWRPVTELTEVSINRSN